MGRAPGMLAAVSVLALMCILWPGPMRVDAAPPTPCAGALAGAPTAAALRPAGMRLSISFPRAGESVTKVLPSDSITVSVDYWGPELVVLSGPRAIDDKYHLVFVLDGEVSEYLGGLSPITRCDPHIVHSADTHVMFDRVLHGAHTLWVVLAGSNDVAVNPPAAAGVTFVVQ